MTELSDLEKAGLVKAKSGPIADRKEKPEDFAQRITQQFLETLDPKNGKLRLLNVLEANYKRATDPRSGQGKASSDYLTDRAYRKAKPSETVVEATKAGFQVIFVNRPELVDVPHIQELPEPQAPEFIDANFEEEK